MSDANKNLVRRHFEEIWNQRKTAALFAAIAPGKVRGPATMRGTAECAAAPGGGRAGRRADC
jgi:hypothetical protein